MSDSSSVSPPEDGAARLLAAIAAARSPDGESSAGAYRDGVVRELWAIADAARLGVAVLDGRGLLVHHNDGARCFWEPEVADAVGASFFRDVLALPDAEALERRYASSGPGAFLEVEAIPRRREHPIRVFVRGVSPHGPNGGRLGIALLEDLGTLEVERRRRERAERMASIGEMVATVVHEVNNPLTSILGFAQLLIEDATDPAQRAGLEIIARESTRAAEIISRNLRFVREPGERAREPVNLNELVEEVLELRSYGLNSGGIAVRADLDPQLPAVPGDPDGLRQIVLNVIINAEQALLSVDSPDRRLIIRSRMTGDGVVLTVVDNGPGIPPQILPHLFEPGRTTKDRGTGLGLAISHSIARDHRGELWVESKKGAGTSVGLRLPSGAESGAPAPEASPAALGPQPRRTLRVLVADDEATIRLAVRLALEDRGHRVVEAATADEAMELARSVAFDAALVDVQMPGDGLAFLDRLGPDNPMSASAILLTGDVLNPRVQDALEGGRPHLAKPFRLPELIALVERVAG